METMSTVYKYCDALGVEILEKLELKVTPPNQFNDPFEFSPHMICTNPLRRSKLMLQSKEYLLKRYDREKAVGIFKGSFSSFCAQVKWQSRSLTRHMAKGLPQSSINAGRELLNAVSRRYGVLCLTKTRTSILMWGHYADKHQGFVIGFNSKAFSLHPVDYQRERIVWDSSLVEQERDEAFADQLLLRKNEDWKYEDEVRQIFNLASLKQRPLKDGRTGYFLAIRPEAVTSVTLGARCSGEIENRVRLALKNPLLSHVTFDCAHLHDSKFEIVFQ